MRSIAIVAFIASAITTSFAFVVALTLHAPFGVLLLFAFWCAALGLGILEGPRLLLSKARYVITDQHVIAIYGPFRRSIERRSISFARIYWDEKQPDTGNIELVRAVRAPERVWAIVRGAERVAPRGGADRPLAQRLDVGERVIWSAQPRQKLKRFVPTGQREWGLLALAAFLFIGVVRMAVAGIPALGKVHQGGVPFQSFAFVALAIGIGSTILLLFAIACYLVYEAILRTNYLVAHTRYLVTNKRVLIQRRSEELHLDRTKILDVIETPKGDGLYDLFLVLDGPRARAVAASGAFGELARGPNLRPVFEAVEDAESVSKILRDAAA
jgi:hypothetical protein